MQVRPTLGGILLVVAAGCRSACQLSWGGPGGMQGICKGSVVCSRLLQVKQEAKEEGEVQSPRARGVPRGRRQPAGGGGG